MLEQGQDKARIQRETGNIVGVNNASFQLDAGEVFCIMGLSGSGKSTLIRCINRLIEPTAGHIFFTAPNREEQEVTAMNAQQLRAMRTRDMSMVFQNFALFPHRTVLSNAVYGLEIQGRDKQERERIGQSTLDMVGLGEWAASYPRELSGGMQQRVGLARALATQASVLLMDEPFSALDPLIKVNMQRELMRIQGELERTILFITHDLDEAMRIGDRIAIMENGGIVQIGTPEEILVNPRTDYVADFVTHADPTGVLTATTIAIPFKVPEFQQAGESGDIRYFSRATEPDLRYGVDTLGRLRTVIAGERTLAMMELEALLNQTESKIFDGPRREDLVPCCREQTILRDILRGRTFSIQSIAVTDGQGYFRGVVDEPALVHAILEKKGR